MKSLFCAIALVLMSSLSFAADDKSPVLCGCDDVNSPAVVEKTTHDGKNYCRRKVMCAQAVKCASVCYDKNGNQTAAPCAKVTNTFKCEMDGDTCPAAQACVDKKDVSFDGNFVSWDGKPPKFTKNASGSAPAAEPAASGGGTLTNPLDANPVQSNSQFATQSSAAGSAAGTQALVNGVPLHDGARNNRGVPRTAAPPRPSAPTVLPAGSGNK